MPEIKTTFHYKYLEIIQAPVDPKKKTFAWDVLGLNSGDFLGQVRWHNPWRQYCFFPNISTLFNKGCMEDLCNFIMIQMEARKKK